MTDLTPAQEKLNEAQALLGRDEAAKAAVIAAELVAADSADVEAGYTLAVAQRVQHHHTGHSIRRS